MTINTDYSLRMRFLRYLLVPIVTAIVIVGVLTFYNAYHEAEELYDAQLSRSADIILALVVHELGEHKPGEVSVRKVSDLTGHEYEEKLAYRVWVGSEVIFMSNSAKDFGNLIPSNADFYNETVKGEAWRFFAIIEDDSHLIVEVGEKFEVRKELIYNVLLSLFVPFFAIVPLVIIAVWVGVKNGLVLVENIIGEVKKRSVDNLEPLEFSDGIPVELKPLISSIDDLFERLNESIERERRFTDNAAHELRTPLSVIMTSTQVALESDNIEEKNEILQNLLSGVNRATRLVEQLLQFSRIQSSNVGLMDVDISTVASYVLAGYKGKASNHGVVMNMDIKKDLFVKASATPLEILISNLVDNAIKYSKTGSAVDVNLGTFEDKVILTVIDHGIGISDDEKEKVLERFYRGKTRGVSGAGLGLSMVKWISDELGTDLELSDTKGGGLTVSVLFRFYNL